MFESQNKLFENSKMLKTNQINFCFYCFFHMFLTQLDARTMKLFCLTSLVIYQCNLQAILKFTSIHSQLANANFLQVMSNPHLKNNQNVHWHIYLNVKHVARLWLCSSHSATLGNELRLLFITQKTLILEHAYNDSDAYLCSGIYLECQACSKLMALLPTFCQPVERCWTPDWESRCFLYDVWHAYHQLCTQINYIKYFMCLAYMFECQ